MAIAITAATVNGAMRGVDLFMRAHDSHIIITDAGAFVALALSDFRWSCILPPPPS
jgi:hypothetical protein